MRPAKNFVRGRRLVAWLCAAMAACAANAQAPETVISPGERLGIERLALGKARTRLLPAIQSQSLKPELTVGAWVASDVALDRALRIWVRSQPTFGAARIYSDRTGEVDVRVTPGELARELLSLREQFPAAGEGLSAAEIEAAARRWSIVWVTGIVDEPLPERARVDGWEDVSAEGTQAARNAARDDAIYALLDEAARLRVTAARRLDEFLASSAAVEDAVLDGLRTEANVKVELAPDQVAVAEAAIPIPALIRILTDVHARLYQGDMFQSPDFREMALTAGIASIRATGLAAPPARYLIKPKYELIELDRPTWADSTLTTTGIYEPHDSDDFPAAMREELARFDGIDRLRRMVEGIELRKGITVEQFLGYHRQLKDDVVVFLGGARAIGRPEGRPDGGVAVKVELPLQRLWWILRRGMKTIDADPASQPAASQPAGSQPIPAGVG
ncbi:MAG: hypothetical protein IT450_08965 [Phycisphaerales bacterium]|nr:hypothetical protein [Phycisphaerales bacterium]